MVDPPTNNCLVLKLYIQINTNYALILDIKIANRNNETKGASVACEAATCLLFIMSNI